MVSWEKVMNGIARYFDKHIYAGMNDWQEVLARSAVGMTLESGDRLKGALMGNGIVKTFCIMDENGNVDVDRLASVLKAEIQKKGRVSIKIPVFGTFVFTDADVDELHRIIVGGEYENHQNAF